MKTIVLESPGQFHMADTLHPSEISVGEALVRIGKVGICGTDYHAYRGRQPFFQYPRVLGHELGVEIIDIAENELGLQKGDRCMVEPYYNCGECVACKRGKPNCCTSLKVLGVHIDGGMREYLKVPIRKLHRSNKLSLEELALVETIGIGTHAVARAQIMKGEYVVVLGAGPIGLGAIEMARADGAKIIVVDINPARLEFCKSSLGIRYTVNAKEKPEEYISDLTNGEMATVVIDCTGNVQSMESSINYMAHGGKLIFVGLFIGEFSFQDPEFHKRETTLLSSRNSTPEDLKKVLRYLENGSINSKNWITHKVGAGEMMDHFADWLNPESGVIKAIVDWEK